MNFGSFGSFTSCLSCACLCPPREDSINNNVTNNTTIQTTQRVQELFFKTERGEIGVGRINYNSQRPSDTAIGLGRMSDNNSRGTSDIDTSSAIYISNPAPIVVSQGNNTISIKTTNSR